MRKIIYYSLIITVIGLFHLSCEDDTTPTLYQPNPTGETPVINSVEPANFALAGVSVVTINGANFSPDTSLVIAYFNSVPAKIFQSSTNQLVVKAPNLVSDSVVIKIAVVGALNFSQPFLYQLKAAYAEIRKPNGELLYNENSTMVNQLTNFYGIAGDNQENLFTSVAGPVTEGVKKITPIGEISDYAPKGGEPFFSGMKMGPNDTIYAARNQRGIWQVVEGVQTPSQPWALFSSGTITDLDFDSDLNIWGVGNAIYSVTRQKDLTTFSSLTGTFRSVRVFNNALYVAGTSGGTEGVWKLNIISANSLGSPELYIDLTQDTVTINAITFSADGDLIIGTNRTIDPIIIIHPDKSREHLYPGVIPPNTSIRNFVWGTGEFLYFTKPAFVNVSSGNIVVKPNVVKLNMQKQGAPHFGR